MSSESQEQPEAPVADPEVSGSEGPSQGESGDSPEPQWIDLPSGEALNDEEAGEAMKVSPAKIILVAGENDTGKTSLLCGVFERYLSGDFAGQLFCGSRTLRAFDRRSFLQRAEAGLKLPDMERTRLPAGQLALLHLELQSKGSGERAALLMTDLAGEAFKLIRNNPEECKRYPVLSRVDCVLLLLDAERLGTEQRHGHVSSTRTMLRSLLQSEMLRDGVPITLGLSKWDVVGTKAHRESAQADALTVLGPTTIDSTKAHPTDISRIAAAPRRAGDVHAGHGLSDLVSSWVGAESPAEEMEITGAEGSEASSGFDLFQGEGDVT